MKASFQVKTTKVLTKYVGFELDEKPEYVVLNCKAMIKELAGKFGLANSKLVESPGDPGFVWEDADDERYLEEKTIYMSLVGSLMYISCLCRPDVAYIVNRLSRKNAKPSARHFGAAKRVLQYLFHSSDLGLKLYKGTGKQVERRLTCWSDANYAREEAKSTSGWVIKFNRSLVDFGSNRQKYIARSTFEAEFIALSKSVEQVILFQEVLKFVKLPLTERPQVFCDNQATIQSYQARECTKRGRHINVSFHYTRKALLERQFKLDYVDTKANVADVMTKVLPKEDFKRLKKMLLEQ